METETATSWVSRMVSVSQPEPYLLLIDDEPDFLDPLRRLYTQQGFQVRTARSGAAAARIIQSDPVAVAVVDVQLPDIKGPALIQKLQASSPSTRFIALTGFGSAQVATDMLNAGADAYFTKPIRDLKQFHALILEPFQEWKADRAKRSHPLRAPEGQAWQALREDMAFASLKGKSPAMRGLIREIKLKGALQQVPVLIRGESGTGKELVAQALHTVCFRGEERPFVAVNCAAIPHDLFESELFGHEQGSFTGASQQRQGLCAAAAGGTLFLDEVGEIPQELQAKLLRVLEQRTYRRVGSDRVQTLRARVIAATNIDLETAIQDGRFREDLYYRLSGQEIVVPPLRSRREDISLLAYHFVDKYNQAFERSVTKISREALELLASHDWLRNNVRELDREIQRALVYCTDHSELPADLLFSGSQPVPAEAPSALGDLSDLLGVPYKDAMSEGTLRLRRWFLLHHLQQASWNKSQVAKNAQMQRGQISRWVRELGLEDDQ